MKSKTVYVAVGIGIIIIALTIFSFYSVDQAKIRGFNFGNNLQAIQDELKQTQSDFYSKKRMLDENSISKEEFLEFSKDHIQRMDNIISKYGNMTTPQSFSNAVKLFKMSTQKQLESDKMLIEWVRTNDTASKVQSDLLLQESFEDEMAALASYNKAKNPSGQS